MTECIIWDGAKNRPNGYGVTYFKPPDGSKPRLALAHRAVYELLVGPIPTGMTLDHLCRVRLCVNYQHLEPVTDEQNRRRSPLLYGHKTHCKRGHSLEDAYVWKQGRVCRQCRRQLRPGWG